MAVRLGDSVRSPPTTEARHGNGCRWVQYRGGGVFFAFHEWLAWQRLVEFSLIATVYLSTYLIQAHENVVYQKLYRGSAAECRGWLMGWGGVAYQVWGRAYRGDVFPMMHQ